MLAVGYTYRFELRSIADRVLAELMPGRAAQLSGRAVEIVRGSAGDFQVAAQVNGTRIAMVLDTGASAVVLTQDAAKAAGLPLELLVLRRAVDTANGRTRAASVTIDRIAVGEIIERSVPALIAQPGQLRTNLLGMTFLNRLRKLGSARRQAGDARQPYAIRLAAEASPRPAAENSPKPISSCRLRQRDARAARRRSR